MSSKNKSRYSCKAEDEHSRSSNGMGKQTVNTLNTAPCFNLMQRLIE